MGRKIKHYDYATQKLELHKLTSEDLATDIFKDESGKKATLVRKQKERLQKRMHSLTKK